MTRKMIPQWEPYEAEQGADYIPENKWSKDHLTVLLYCETRTVDHKGVLSGDHMRTNVRLHRELLGWVMYQRGTMFTDEYPTRLKDGVIRRNHDDWSCLEDLVAAGYLTAETAQVRDTMVASTDCRIKLTAKGLELARRLRQWKAAGGIWADFSIEVKEVPEFDKEENVR